VSHDPFRCRGGREPLSLFPAGDDLYVSSSSSSSIATYYRLVYIAIQEDDI